MSKNIRIIFFVLLLVFIFFTVLIVRYNSSDEKTFIINDDEGLKATGFLGNDYYSYKNENNLFGVRDAEGKKLTDALWKDIKSIDDDRFIVLDPYSGKYGIVDINENIIVPLIYKKFISYDDRYIVGITEKNDGKHGNVLFDTKGNILIEEEWDACTETGFDNKNKITDGFLQLKKNKDYCRIKFDDDQSFRMYYIEMNRELLGRNIKITARPSGNVLSLRNTYSVYYEIVDRSTSFVTAVFNGDASGIKNLISDEKYGENVQSYNSFRGAELKYLGDIHPLVTSGADGRKSYSCRMNVLISVPGDIKDDGSYMYSDDAFEFTVLLEPDSEGKMKITGFSQKDIDVSQLKLPKDFYPEETTVSDVTVITDIISTAPVQTTVPSETVADLTEASSVGHKETSEKRNKNSETIKKSAN